MLAVRLIPFIPFEIVNVCAGLTRVRFFTFLWTTVVGMIPVTILYTSAGNNLSQLESLRDILSWKDLGFLMSIALIVMAPGIIQLFWHKNTGKK